MSSSFGPDGHESLRRIDEMPSSRNPSALVGILREALALARFNEAWLHFRLAEALHASGDLAASSRAATAALQDPLNELARSFCHECIADAEAAEGNLDAAIRHFILSVLESNVNSAAWEKLRRIVERALPDQAAWLEFQSLGVPEPMRRKYVSEPEWECIERIAEPLDAERRVFATCHDVRPAAPLGFDPIHGAIVQRLKRRSLTDELAVYALMGAQLHYRSGSMHVIERGRLVTPLSTGDLPKAVLARTPSRRLYGTCAVLVDQFYTSNYAHWLLDWLPRLHMYRSVHSCSIDYVLVNSLAREYEHDHLARLGISREQVVEAAESPLIEPDVLLIRSGSLLVFHPAFFAADWALSFLRHSLLPFDVPERASTTKRRLFISRSDAAARHLEDEDVVFEALQREFGVERLRLSELSAEEQACSFRDAELIVGVHGAGFANVVFCASGTAVLEIFSPVYGTAAFFEIAQALELRYACIQGDDELTLAPELLSVSPYGDRDVRIEPRRVCDAVRQLLQTADPRCGG